MGRIAQEFKIPPSTFCTVANKFSKPLYQQMKDLAHRKGLSVHTLIEIVLERYIKENT